MDYKLLLAKCVTLLYRENQISDDAASGVDVVRRVLEKIKIPDASVGTNTDRDILVALRSTVGELLNTPKGQKIDRIGLLQRIRIDTGDNDNLYEAIENAIIDDLTPELLTPIVINNRRVLNDYLKTSEIGELITAASSLWNYGRDRIIDEAEFVANLRANLEKYAINTEKSNSAILESAATSSKAQIAEICERVRVSVVENRYFKTGWQGLNRMLQGGFRPGEFWVGAALQHCYKTGSAQSIFNQIARYNKPFDTGKTGKPTMALYAFEDTMPERFGFMFKQMMYTDTREFVNIENYTTEQIAMGVVERLSANGWEVLFFRINPTMWSYQDQFRHHQQLVSEGHDIQVVVMDYLEKIPTTGCIQTGPTGNDILDLFTRMRMHYNSKGIFCYTPHQISTDAKKLLRGTITEDKFASTLPGRGYYKGTSQLDQIPDGILLFHKFLSDNDKRTYFAIQRDRHRISSILEEKYKHMYLQFPPEMPIPDDLEGEDSTMYRLPLYSASAASDLFGSLEEL